MSSQDENISASTKKGSEEKAIAATDKVPAVDKDESSVKRPAETAVDAESTKRSRGEGQEVLDLANTLGFKVGDRLEVEWEIMNESDNSDSKTHWWAATLLEHNGRTEDSVAIRTLDYDPYPEGGFPERSQEEVIFMGEDLLIDPVSHQELRYRREGEDSTVWYGKRDDVEELINTTLMNAMMKNAGSWKSLSSAQQAAIAEMVAVKKEKLMDLMSNHPKGVITSTDMQSILAQVMEE